MFSKWVVVPRAEVLRLTLQTQLMPLYDDRLIIDYVSPVEEDKEHRLKVMEKAPWVFPAVEWREAAGAEPFGDERDEIHAIPTGITLGPLEPTFIDDGEPDPNTPPLPALSTGPVLAKDGSEVPMGWEKELGDDELEVEGLVASFDAETEPAYLERQFATQEKNLQQTRDFTEIHRIARRLEPEMRQAFADRSKH